MKIKKIRRTEWIFDNPVSQCREIWTIDKNARRRGQGRKLKVVKILPIGLLESMIQSYQEAYGASQRRIPPWGHFSKPPEGVKLAAKGKS